MAKRLRTPKKKWLRRWVKQLDEELAAAKKRTLKNTYIISHTAGGIKVFESEFPVDFIVKLMVGLVLIAFSAAIVIEVVALTS